MSQTLSPLVRTKLLATVLAVHGGQPKVTQLHYRSFAVKQNVLRLQVPVDKPLGMNVLNTFQNLLKDGKGLFNVDTAILQAFFYFTVARC
uniref:Putative secreted protein n=1 Tax=Ixodes ricinus TaxID=34613 RepID=A0A6B0UGD1_IXORI